MAERVGTVESVVINVFDIERQRAFWGAILGVEVRQAYMPFFLWFEPQRPGGVKVALQAVEVASDGPRRLHLDFEVPDRAAAVAQVIALGGSVVDEHSLGDFTWSVLADPEGNEFCMASHG